MTRGTRRARLLAIALVLAMFGLTAASCTARDAAAAACLENEDRPPPMVVPTPDPYWPRPEGMLIPDHTPIDARGIVFEAESVAFKLNRDPTGETRNDVCVVGGTIRSTLPPDSTWTTWHGNYGFRVEAPSSKIIGAELRNLGDGIQYRYPMATDWQIIGVRADGGGIYPNAGIHDDCVEDDEMHSGQIIDSKFDGCGTFLSATSNAGTDGSANEITISDTLARLQEFENSFCPVTIPPGSPGACSGNGYHQHGGFFKFSTRDPDDGDGAPPKLRLTRVMLRADQMAAYGGNENGKMAPPPGTTCDDVVLINTATWIPADVQAWLDEPGCAGEVRLGTIGNWNAAVAAWNDAHPVLDRP